MPNKEKQCTCGEPHVSKRICHRYNGKPCHVIDTNAPCIDGENITIKEKQDWKDEFDKQFKVIIKTEFDESFERFNRCEGGFCQMSPEEIKAFISTLLQSVVKDLLEMKKQYRMNNQPFTEKFISVEDIISYFKNKHGLDI